MCSKKQKLVTTVTALTLGCGFNLGLTPAFADSQKGATSHESISSIQKQNQIPFTGYVISVDSNYLVVANTATKNEALSYRSDWWELVLKNKILRVPISNGGNYTLGERLNVYAVGWTKSLPPIAVMLKIEKVAEK
ncbi:DUF3221 domain-containing protein [Bacillus thuringiensis]|uniref:DUF3221 domain-containing protein n=1 Tax=Bacillus thuringiensis TaxID=1428 RepID=UPI0005AF1421|nr:DUF3221 domain-containing protein [Bacillus thuringiensis]KIP23060.1 hypothetical protein BG10_4948 [Bacillus thuringiensis serovar morrisoni]MCT6948021.1 DUF3221 domain-containing protein [Bacillus thuringiensis]MED2077217.1 DUF3221 domain-containing protein [Bacillus thuringiensis]NUW50746.1 DUF3221 domain-containing protein [Bacillus thuringiensis]HDR6822430.1 DUF3221 domain-containing protein [Bacillus thuringiensis]